MTLDEAIVTALRENQVSLDYDGVIRDLMKQPPDAWPRCCGSDCDPCVTSLARVILRVRALLAQSP